MSRVSGERRVVVTGMAVATALGCEVEDFWTRLLAGETGISRVEFAPEEFRLAATVAGQIPADRLMPELEKHGIREHERTDQLALLVATRALLNAGLSTSGEKSFDMDVLSGTGHGAMAYTNQAVVDLVKKGPRGMRPTSLLRGMTNRAANMVSIRFNLTGTSYAIAAACASGTLAVGEGFHRIRHGISDAVLAIGNDSAIDLPTFVSWNRLGMLSPIEDPATAYRPFDRNRQGPVLAEGAAALVLEDLASAERRGASVLAEVAGFGTSSDAKFIHKPDIQGQVRSTHRALASAGIEPQQIGLVNAHGTGTQLSDEVESRSLREALGAHAAQVPVFCTKAQVGHPIGGTGAIELVAAIEALRRGLAPACRNLDEPDAACPLNFVRDEPLAVDHEYSLKSSFAFGGTNASVVLRRFT